jgi:arsenate reductase
MADDITIYHNPACGTSHKVLAALREAGHEPKVVEYLKAGWTRPQLQRLLGAMGATPRDILRAKEAPDLLQDASDDASWMRWWRGRCW